MGKTAERVLKKCVKVETVLNMRYPQNLSLLRKRNPTDLANAEIMIRDIIESIVKKAFMDLRTTGKEIDLLSRYLKIFREKQRQLEGLV